VDVSPPIVIYKEGVRDRTPGPIEGKSPNKHNRFYILAEKLEEPVLKAMVEGKISDQEVKKKDQELIDQLVELGMSRDEVKKVILHIHPTVSEVTDQTKELTISGERDELPLAFSEIRESDSIVKAKSGQIIAIGGLMRNASRRVDYFTPVLGRVPGVGRLFRSQRESESKTELVILLRPIVVDQDEDWSEIIRPAAERVMSLSQSAP